MRLVPDSSGPKKLAEGSKETERRGDDETEGLEMEYRINRLSSPEIGLQKK
jgi:hypothetical protein